MVKLGSTILMALLATSYAAPSSLRSNHKPKQDFDLDLPWASVHVGKDGTVSVTAPGVDLDKPADGPISISAPGVDIESPTDDEDGPVSVSSPFANVHNDSNGHVTVDVPEDGEDGGDIAIHAPPSTTTVEFPDDDDAPSSGTQCQPDGLAEAKALSQDATCDTALPRFFSNISGGRFVNEDNDERKAIMDGLCATKCGSNYTAYLLAARALDFKCGRGVVDDKEEVVEEGDKGMKHRHDKDKDQDGDDEDEEQSLFPILDEIFGGKHKHDKKTHHHHHHQEEDNDDIHIPANALYPGLALGCLKADDGAYCATKRAAVNDKDGCDFYKSCCYGEYLKGLDGVDHLIDEVERKCPGSKAFANQTCKR